MLKDKVIDRYSLQLGRLIVDRRKKLGKTQKTLASELCISKQYLSDIENGKRHPVDAYFLQMLASMIQVSTDYIFYLTGQVPPDIRRMDASVEQTIEGFNLFRKLLRERGKREEEPEPVPMMVIHLYREENGDLLVSEQHHYNHTIHPTKSREEAFKDFWETCAHQLEWLMKHEAKLGWSLKDQLVYLRQLRAMDII